MAAARPAVVRMRPSCRGAAPQALELQVLAEAPCLGPAHRNLRALRVLHPEDVIPAEPGHYLLDLIDGDEVRAMHAPERGGVEARLQLIERPEIARTRNLTSNYINRLVGHRREDYLVGLNQQEPLPCLHRDLISLALSPLHELDDAFQVIVQRPLFTAPPPGALDCALEAVRIHRLQQVVDGVDFERLDRVLVVRGHEYDGGRTLLS